MTTLALPDTLELQRAAESQLIRKITRRLVPFLAIAFVIAYLDRSNIGIASLTMMESLQMSAAQFGFAAGLFFLGYFAGELPSNLLQVRFGARRWIARIMVSWGLVAMGMAFVTGPTSLYIMRVLLGAAEAGFLPGAVLYLAFWFPERYRTRIFGLFLVAIPASVVIGAPLSAALLYLDGLGGLHGWQWLFLVEGAPAIVLGILCLRLLPDGPNDAKWLNDEERTLLANMMITDASVEPVSDISGGPIRKALLNPKMWQMALYGSGISAGSYSIIFFLPQIISEFGTTHLQTGLLTTLPFAAGAVAMIAWSRHADRTGERKWHAVLPLLLAGGSLVIAASIADPVAKMAALTMAAMGLYMAAALLWSFIPLFFRAGKEAAAAVAIINMLGILAGFVQPTVIGHLKTATGSYSSGLIFTSVVVMIGALTGLVLLSGRAARIAPPVDRN